MVVIVCRCGGSQSELIFCKVMVICKVNVVVVEEQACFCMQVKVIVYFDIYLVFNVYFKIRKVSLVVFNVFQFLLVGKVQCGRIVWDGFLFFIVNFIFLLGVCGKGGFQNKSVFFFWQGIVQFVVYWEIRGVSLVVEVDLYLLGLIVELVVIGLFC